MCLKGEITGKTVNNRRRCYDQWGTSICVTSSYQATNGRTVMSFYEPMSGLEIIIQWIVRCRNACSFRSLLSCYVISNKEGIVLVIACFDNIADVFIVVFWTTRQSPLFEEIVLRRQTIYSICNNIWIIFYCLSYYIFSNDGNIWRK